MTALAVLVLCAAVDALYVGWQAAARNGRATVAAGYSGAIQLVGVVAILLVVDDRRLLAANVLGHMAGSAIGVRLSKSKDRSERQA